MRYRVLAADYDGTLAEDGRLGPEARAALQRWRRGGRAAVLVTGRRLEELLSVCDDADLFDRIVAENGALLYTPSDGTEQVFGAPPPPALIDRLRAAGALVICGRIVVATGADHAAAARAALHALALPHAVVLNKDAAMILPPGIDKASGLAAALRALRLHPRKAAAIGDAENDLPLLDAAGLGAAVGNALPAVKARARWLAAGRAGTGVAQFIDYLLAVG